MFIYIHSCRGNCAQSVCLRNGHSVDSKLKESTIVLTVYGVCSVLSKSSIVHGLFTDIVCEMGNWKGMRQVYGH